ncbi:hypothetical protein [Caballeronia sp. M23-90]
MASPALTDISRADRTRDVQPVKRVDHGPPPQFMPLRMNETLSMEPRVPQKGEVFVFRFRSQWQRISAHDAATWLTQDETRRAALLPSPALRYRYISSRAVLRLAVARLSGCEPSAIDLRDDAKGRLLAQATGTNTVLCADIGYAGVWIMLAISAAQVGLGTSLPSFGSGSDAPLSDTASPLPSGRQRARDNSLLSAAGHRSATDSPDSADDLAANGAWYVFDLPMPGQLCASICSLTPINTIHAFGWSKRNENGR